MRDETECSELVEQGWNCLVGTNKNRIVAGASEAIKPNNLIVLYGDSQAADLMIDALLIKSSVVRKEGE